VRERDPKALAAFFERYFERVYSLAFRLLGERNAAEDVTQEVFFKVHRAAHQLDPSRDPGPWLTTIAYNTCRDVWRSSAHRLSRQSGPLEGSPGNPLQLTRGTNDPERDLIAKERRQMVVDAIEQLPEPLRMAVLLYDYQGLSHQEIAEITGLNHAAARKRYSRALASLGEMLKGKLG
jgi:RNA polymerase sigma-70 factor (ECF subfamily)